MNLAYYLCKKEILRIPFMHQSKRTNRKIGFFTSGGVRSYIKI